MSRGLLAPAFTLIELLAVVATIGVLAALLLPALGRAKEHARMVKCLSNMRQIGVAVQLYIHENNSCYPTTSGDAWNSFRLGGGDPDPKAAAAFGMEWATNRILWPYTHSRELYRCPADKGMNNAPEMLPFNSLYEMMGSSYKYNGAPWVFPFTLLPQKDYWFGNAGKKESWVSQPSRYIILHEPPATPYWYGGGWYYYFWHYARGASTVVGLGQVTDRFISSSLFADAHAAKHDFTRSITSRPDHPFEPTPDWYFYEPTDGRP